MHSPKGHDRLIEPGDEPQNWVLYKGHVLAWQGRLHAAIEQFTRCGAYLDRAHICRRLAALPPSPTTTRTNPR
ncbi:MAG: hypothetical protein KKB50_06265 [Planctomycetes bacterium]|nr:hypothetical protein [Planctomycetota bacterium]